MIHLDNGFWIDAYDSNIATWKKIYKDCDFKVWGFEDIKDIIEQSEWCKRFYQEYLKIKKSYPLALMSDYIRLYLLNKYGGLYIDTDVFALNRMPDNIFKNNDLIVAWDPGFRSTYYVPDYIRKYNIEKTYRKEFRNRETKRPFINNGAFFFSKENNSILIEEMRGRDDFAKYDFNPNGFHCLTLTNTLQDKIKFNVDKDYQKVINKDGILILNSNYASFEPEEAYFDYDAKEPIYNVHQCLLTSYNGNIPVDYVSDFKEAFDLFVKCKFEKLHTIFIPIDNDNIEEFNDFSYLLRKFVGPVKKLYDFRIKPMPKL